jgi:hypothetical protein
MNRDMSAVNLTINTPFDTKAENLAIDSSTIPRDGEDVVLRVLMESYLSQDSAKPLIGAASGERFASIHNRVLRMSSVWGLGDKRAFTKLWSGPQLNVTIPTLYSAASLKSVEPPRSVVSNVTTTFRAAYPVVNTLCMHNAFTGVIPSLEIPAFEVDGSFSGNITRIDAIAKNASRFISEDGVQRYYAPVWLPSPDPNSKSIVGIFTYQQLQSSESEPLLRILELAEEGKIFHDRNHSIDIYTCTIASFWESGEVQLQSKAVKTADYARTRSLDARARTLNVDDLNTNAQLHLQMTQSILKDPEYNYWTGWTKNLATAFALAIARIPDVPIVINPYGDYIAGLEPEKPPGQDDANITTFHYTMVDYGFGYGTRSTSVHLAIAVILTYCIVTISYMAYTITTGNSSTAWNLGIELVTLALQSKKPDHLGHASVGIDSINTFSEPVGIRVNAQNELELVFAHDRGFGTRDLRKIERNKEY